MPLKENYKTFNRNVYNYFIITDCKINLITANKLHIRDLRAIKVQTKYNKMAQRYCQRLSVKNAGLTYLQG